MFDSDGIAAPDDDRPGVDEVRERDAGHLPVDRDGGLGRGRRAERAREPRGAEPAPERFVHEVVREDPVRSVVVIGEDRLAAVARADVREAPRDLVERRVPGHGLERVRSLPAPAHERRQDPVRAVHAVRIAAHLRAHEPRRDRLRVGRAQRRHAAALDLGLERARVRAVHRTRGLDPGGISR